MNVSRSVPPDCYLEDLEHPGILPPSPARVGSPLVSRRSSSCRHIVIDDDTRSVCVTRPTIAGAETPLSPAPEEYHGRLPGTFDSLYHVQDSGVTPSPRSDTPLVLFPVQDRTKDRIPSCISRKLKTSLGVRLGRFHSRIMIIRCHKSIEKSISWELLMKI